MTTSLPERPSDTAGINPYAPPASRVADLASHPEVGPDLFTASTTKFVLMSICTGGFYELYWFYKNWVYIKRRTGLSIIPFWRAFFAPLWAYSCFREIVAIGESKSPWDSVDAAGPPIGRLAFVYFLLVASSRLPDPYWLVSLLSFLPMIPVNSYASAINARHEGYVQNRRFTKWNWMGLILGNLVLVLAFIGAFLKR
jgi:hypothetical protein